jgi:hypothetical protein
VKKISIYSSIAVFFLTFAFPAGGVLASAPQPIQSPLAPFQTSTSAVLLQVVQPVVNAKISLAQNQGGLQQNVAGCQTNLLADGSVNLNQPAGCFSLKVLPPVDYSQVRLSVAAPKTEPVKIVVAAPQSKISSLDFIPGLPGQSIPAMPLVFFGFGLVYGLWDKKLAFKKLAIKASSLKFAFSLHRLQVLRC